MVAAGGVMAQTDVCSIACANFTASYGLCQILTDSEQQYLCTCDAYQGIGEIVLIPFLHLQAASSFPPPAPQLPTFYFQSVTLRTPPPQFCLLWIKPYVVLFELLGSSVAGHRYKGHCGGDSGEL